VSLAHPARPFGLQDLLDSPADGYRYEVIDGALVVNPAPAWRHQEIVVNLAMILRQSAPEHVAVLPNPVWRIGPEQIPEPDLVVVDRSALGDIAVEGTPLSVVEVLSPSNRGADLIRKRALYAEAGCPCYWIVDPGGPTVTILTLENDRYQESTAVEGSTEIVVDRPFPLRIRPADL
jgi:Uma2 family endonuclease